jgi:hypothetical protein
VKEAANHYLPSSSVRQPNDCCLRNGSYGGQGKAAGFLTWAGGFAVYELSLFVLAITSRKLQMQSHHSASDCQRPLDESSPIRPKGANFGLDPQAARVSGLSFVLYTAVRCYDLRENFSAQLEESGIEPSAIGVSSLTFGTVATHGRTDLEPGCGGAAGLLLISALRISKCLHSLQAFLFALPTAAPGKSAKRGEPQIYLVGVTLWAPAGSVVGAFAFPVPRGTGRKQKRATWPRHIGRVLGPFFFPQRKRNSRNEVVKKPFRGH